MFDANSSHKWNAINVMVKSGKKGNTGLTEPILHSKDTIAGNVIITS